MATAIYLTPNGTIQLLCAPLEDFRVNVLFSPMIVRVLYTNKRCNSEIPFIFLQKSS